MMQQFIKKYKNLALPVKAALWFTISNVLQRGVSIITVPIFTRLLSTEQYGTYSVYLSWLNILGIFTSLNLYYGVFNKAMVKYSDDRDRYIASMQGLVLTISTLWFVVYLLFRNVVNSYFGLSTALMLMMFVEMAITPALQFWSGKKRFDYAYVPIVLVTLLKSVLNPMLGVIGVLVSVHKTEARVLATVLVEVIICGYILIYQFVKGKVFFNKAYWSYAVKFNIPLIPHYLSGSILNQGDRIVIERLVSKSAVAFYSVAYNVGMLTQLITNAISQSITPWLYDCLKNKNYSDINKRLRPIMVLVASICVLLMLFAPEVVRIFAAPQYSEAVYVIPPIAASVFFIYLYNIYSNFEFYYEKRLFITIASIVSAILNLGLNFIFIPQYGYLAAGYTTLACYMIYAYSHYVFSVVICKEKTGGKRIFSFIDVLIISIVLVIITVLVNFLYSTIYIRYLSIVIIVITGIVNRKRIIKMIQR